MPNPEMTEYRFTVKEGQASASGKDDAPVWLMCEPTTTELSVVGNNGYLSIRLKPGARVAEAQEIAGYLNENIAGIGYTKL